MVTNIFAGVDGGGTRTKVQVENEKGEILGVAISGPSNIRLSVEQAWQSIYVALKEILDVNQISLEDKQYRFHLGLGLAGCEVIEARTEFLAKKHPFTTLELASDAHIACLGAHQGEDGAIIIIGTGVVGYQVENGKAYKVSGWGFPHDDVGGGAWLGLEAARLTFECLDKRRKPSLLAEDVFAFFNNNLDQFVTWANRSNSSEFSRLAPLVIKHSQNLEKEAIRLIKKAAKAINQIDEALMRMQQKQIPLPCCLFGGLAPFIEPWLYENLNNRLTPRRADANVGAILMIRKRVNACL